MESSSAPEAEDADMECADSENPRAEEATECEEAPTAAAAPESEEASIGEQEPESEGAVEGAEDPKDEDADMAMECAEAPIAEEATECAEASQLEAMECGEAPEAEEAAESAENPKGSKAEAGTGNSQKYPPVPVFEAGVSFRSCASCGCVHIFGILYDMLGHCICRAQEPQASGHSRGDCSFQ